MWKNRKIQNEPLYQFLWWLAEYLVRYRGGKITVGLAEYLVRYGGGKIIVGLTLVEYALNMHHPIYVSIYRVLMVHIDCSINVYTLFCIGEILKFQF